MKEEKRSGPDLIMDLTKFYNWVASLFPKGNYRKYCKSFISTFSIGSVNVTFSEKEKIYGKLLRFITFNYDNLILDCKEYFIKYIPKKGDVVIDAGGFPGFFTVYTSKLVGQKGKVICFEPIKKNFKAIQKNLDLNNIKNVILINKGLWNKSIEKGYENSGTSAKVSNNLNSKKIQLTSLDSELKKLGISKVDFIKMDIEGAEIEALDGMRETLKNNKVKLSIASYHIVNGKRTSDEVEKLLKEQGYKSETKFPPNVITYGSNV